MRMAGPLESTDILQFVDSKSYWCIKSYLAIHKYASSRSSLVIVGAEQATYHSSHQPEDTTLLDGANTRTHVNVVVAAVDPGVTDIVTVTGLDGGTRSYSSEQYYRKGLIFKSQRQTDIWNLETADIVGDIIPDRDSSRSEQIGAYARFYMGATPILTASMDTSAMVDPIAAIIEALPRIRTKCAPTVIPLLTPVKQDCT